MSLTKSNIPLLSNYYNHCRPGCLFSQVFSQKCQVFFCPSCPSVCPPSVPCPFHFFNKYFKRNVKFDCRILKYVPKQDSWPNQIKINKKICSRKHECASTYGTYMLGTAELFMYWHNNTPITLYVKQKVLHVGQFFNYVLFVFYMLVIGDIAAPLDNMETKLDSLWCQGERGLTNSSTSIQCHLWWEAEKVIGKMINFPVLYLDSLLFLHLPVFLFQSETNPIDKSFLFQRIGKRWSKQLRKKKAQR